MTGTARGKGRQHRRSIRVLFVGIIFFFGAVVAIGAVGTAAAGDSIEDRTAEQLSATAAPGDNFDPGNVTIPDVARDVYDYAVVPADAVAEEEDTVRVTISAKDLGGGEDQVSGFEFDVAYNETALDYDGAFVETSRLRGGEEDFEAETQGPGVVSIRWWPSFTDSLIDELGESFIEGEGFEDMDAELATIEFHVTEAASDGDSSEIDVRQDGAEMTSGLTSWFPTSTYDMSEFWLGDGEIRIDDDAGEDALDGAIAELDGTEQGGYTDFGEENDPGEDAEVQFPDPAEADRVIEVDGQINEDGEWAANADDVFIPSLQVGPSTADIEVLGDGFEGTIDEEKMTLAADFRAHALGDSFEFGIDATTGVSGELDGDLSLDVDESFVGTGQARIVDNEFVVEEPSGNSQIDDRLDLEDADEEGANYFIFEFEFDFREVVTDPATVAGVVENDAGDPVAGGTVELLDEGEVVEFTETAEDGSYELDGIRAGSYELRADAEGSFEQETAVDVGSGEELIQDLELEAGETNFEVEISQFDDVTAGDTAVVQAAIENTGDGIGEQDISLVADRVVDTETVDLTLSEPDDSTTVTLEWETDAEDAGERTIAVESEDDTDSVDLTVSEADDDSERLSFTATSSPGGFISFAEGSLDEAIAEGVDLPAEGSEIVLEGEIDDDGSWESTNLQFPALDVNGIEATVDVPFGFEGEIDRETGELTLEGQLDVTVEEFDAEFSFEMAATTGQSEALSGEPFDDEGGPLTVVDNEYTIEDETGTALDDEIGLPADDVGENWMEINFDIEVTEGETESGAIEGVIEDQDGEPVEDVSVSVDGEVAETTTDEDGSYELTDVATGTQQLVVAADGYFEQSVDVEVTEGETTEQDIEIEAGKTEFDLTVDADSTTAGNSLSVDAIVENEGNAPGDAAIAVRTETEAGKLLGESKSETTVEPDESTAVSDTILTSEEMVGEATVILEVGGETAETTVTIEEPLDEEGGPDATFTAENTGEGYISFNEETESDAAAEGLAFPDGEILIEGEIYGDRWQSTGVEFPALDAGVAKAEVDPADIDGEIDTEDGTMTFNGGLAVDVQDDNVEEPFSFSVDATTGESGELDGESDLDTDGGTAMLVDNEYTVNDETGSFVDGALGLPLTEPGQAWIQLELELDIQEIEGDGPATGDLEGIVEAENGDEIEDATVDVVDELQDTTTASDGSYSIDSLDTGSYELSIEAAGYESETAEIEIQEDELTQADITLEAGDADFEFDIEASDAEPGETVTTSATVKNTGDGSGTEEVTVQVGESELTETVELGPGEEETITAEWDTDESTDGTYAASVRTDEESAEISEEVAIETAEQPDNAVLIEGTGGFVAFDEPSEDEARSEGLSFPGELTITGELDEEEGTWEAAPEDIYFPDLETSVGIMAGVSAPEGLTGTIDQESGAMTAEGTLRVTVDDLDESFEFDISLTTDESGALTGSASFDDEEGAVTVVDNAFTVDESGTGVIDDQLGLPSHAGETWLELEFDVEIVSDEEAAQQQDNDGETDGEEDEESEDEESEDEESELTFITSLGEAGGFVAIGAGLLLISVNLIGRVLSAVDPDPES